MRHPEVFSSLAEELKKRLNSGASPSLKIWSAACSIGCEPYSLSILCQRLQSEIPELDYEIWATDLNHDFLDKAREARYGKWSIRNLDTRSTDLYFKREGVDFVLRDQFKKGVHFLQNNLMGPPPAEIAKLSTSLDVIFCRNVLIYFDQPRIKQLADRFHDMLGPNGLLILGPSETNPIIFNKFRNLNYPNAVIYSKATNDEFQARSTYVPPKLDKALVNTPETPEPKIRATKRISSPNLANLLQKGEFAAFLDSAEKALYTDDLNSHLHMQCGFAYAQSGRKREAETHLKKALYLDRNNLEAHYLTATLILSDQSSEKRLKPLKRILEKLRNSKETHLKLPDQTRTIDYCLSEIESLVKEYI